KRSVKGSIGSSLEGSIGSCVVIASLILHIGQVVQGWQPELFVGGHQSLSFFCRLLLGGPQFFNAFLDVFIFIGFSPGVHCASSSLLYSSICNTTSRWVGVSQGSGLSSSPRCTFSPGCSFAICR